MPQLRWTPSALADVQRLYRFLAPENPDAAPRAVKTIRSGVKILAHQPQLGRPLEGMEPEFREWLIDFGGAGYLVLYRLDGGALLILAVRPQREAGYSDGQPG
ncbi:MAG: type II toxin-antitoxin system RelE/ParE family toxin [Nitrococcus sp.]|nr:type II toxin-antitoxin system RelE/ParE family toxin [Nitrococcus sp.]